MIKDMFGDELEVGAVFVFPGRASSSLWMNVAIHLGNGKALTARKRWDGEWDVRTRVSSGIDFSRSVRILDSTLPDDVRSVFYDELDAYLYNNPIV